MTIDELAAQMNEQFAKVNERFTGIDSKFAGIDSRFADIDQRFDALEKKMDEGFKDSKIRDEELRDLTRFGLEAREVLRDEMHRRFDEADRKDDEQISLLKDAVRYLR